MSDKSSRESLHVRVPAPLKRQVERYAAEHGLAINAAAIVLLESALRADQRRAK